MSDIKKAINIRINHLGEYDISLANPYNDLGLIHKDKQEYRKAEKYFLKAISISEKNEGPKNPRCGKLYSELGRMFLEEMDRENSLKYIRKSIKIEEIYYGYNHPDLAYSYLDYAEALQLDSKHLQKH